MTGDAIEDLYSKVVDIAQQQAQSSAAMTELHRQNVSKIDALSALLTVQTTNLLGISAALQHLHEARARDVEQFQRLGADGLVDLKEHVTMELKDRETKFWIALVIIAVTGSADVITKLVGVLK